MKKKLAAVTIFFFPMLVWADVSIKGLFQQGTDLLKAVLNFLWMLAFVVFIWGIVRFIAAAGNPEKLKSARNFIIWGLVGIFVLFSFMGIIALLQNTVFQGSVAPSSSPGVFPETMTEL